MFLDTVGLAERQNAVWLHVGGREISGTTVSLDLFFKMCFLMRR
jgi:hypothetical protein